MKNDLLDRPDSFEARLRTGLDNIAAADPVAEPGLFDPEAMTLVTDDRHDLDGRDRRLAPVLVAASVVALTVGGLAALATRDGAPAPAAEPTASQPMVTQPADESVGPVEVCDDDGCDDFDPLPLAPGAATYYRSGAGVELGVETTHLDFFERLTRCAELTPDGASCARIEGIAGAGLVDYVGSDGTTAAEIGTTFTTISPADYAQQWGPTQFGGELSPVGVRGHDGIRYSNEARDAVVWQESPGVLVWVAVDPTLGDRLLEIAEAVEQADPADVPTTIPHRVVVPGLGEPWSAVDNNGDGVLVAVHGGVECVGFGYIEQCGTRIEDRVVVRPAGDSLRVSGSTPSDAVRVRVATSAEVAEVETVSFSPYASRFFSVFVGAGDALSVEWIDADGVVVGAVDAGIGTSPSSNPTDTLPPSGDNVLAIVDASGIPGAGEALEADLRSRGYTVAWVGESTQTFEQSMLMPVDSSAWERSLELSTVLGIGGFDTWSPSLIVGTIPETVTDVVVFGEDGLPAITPPQADATTRP